MNPQVPLSELTGRMRAFRARMDAAQPDWEMAAFLGKVNQYYLTGTRQDGVLLVPRDGEAVFWVRRSFERAAEESCFPNLRPMKSFRDAATAGAAAAPRRRIHLETGLVPFALLQRFLKYFPCQEVAAVDPHIAGVRAVKRPYELALLERAGALHRRVLEDAAPALLRAGMTEAELACELYALMVREGHDGTVGFSQFNVDIAVAQLGFGENSLYPTSFDGPGGCRGLNSAAPVLGSRERKLQKGDWVFVDLGCGVEGYATDKTMTYMFGAPPPEAALEAHRQCVELQLRLAALLKPGAIPSAIYARILAELDPRFQVNFMGCGNRRSAFLGHGVGLQIDEPPVIAEGFDEPLAEGMVLALEPKKGVPGVGLVGTENTYLVTPAGGRSLTGSHPGPILVSS